MISELNEFENDLLLKGKLNWEVKIRAITSYIHEFAGENGADWDSQTEVAGTLLTRQS